MFYQDKEKKDFDTNYRNVEKIGNEVYENQTEENTMETANSEDILSPNATVKKRVYYISCDHIVEEEEKISKNDVNSTEKEIEEKYKEWELEEFSVDRIELYQERNETCPNHFEIKENDGVIVIYQANENGEYKIVDETEINTKYLSEEDQEKLKQGIEIIGEERLNSTLEDYE